MTLSSLQAFTSEDVHLAVAAPSGVVHLIATSSGVPTCLFRSHLTAAMQLLPGKLQLPPVTHLCVSHDRQWLAVAVAEQYSGPFQGASCSSCVCVYSLEAQRLHASLPLPIDGRVASPVAALSFTSASDKLVIITESKDAHLFDLESGARSWTATRLGASLAERMREMPGHVNAVSTDPARDLSAVLIHTPLALCHVDISRPLSSAAAEGVPHKRRRLRDGTQPTSAGGSNGRIIPLEHPALFASYFKPGEALLIELPLDELVRALPPPLARPRFGG